MKKVVLLSIAIIGFVFISKAQSISKNAAGLRLGDSDGFGTEVSYQRALNETNRLEFGLGWRDNNKFDAIRFVGLYQWVMALEGNFNWFYGAGGGLANFSDGDDSETNFFIAGDIGIEYNFDIPLLISLDFRPELGFGDFNDDLDFDIALGIRYQF